jgi:hypothetical protein
MFKISATLCILSFLASSWVSDFSLPRLTNSPADYFFMPFFGYLSVFLAAQLAGRLVPRKTERS